MANTQFGCRQHCLQFMHLPEDERFEAARASMLRLGLFTWPDRELRKWCKESNHALHAARQEAISERKARARDS